MRLMTDRVLGYAQGAFSEVVATDYTRLLPVPGSISLDQAAGMYL